MTTPPWEALRRQLGFKPQLRPDEQGDRLVHANRPEANVGFVDNVVITSRYTLWNFLPVFLLEQFRRFANAYFLFVSILQTIKEISITNGLPLTFVPLSVVLLFDGAVTAREDVKRHADDARANTSRCLALRGGRFVEVFWKDIVVGDVLKIVRNSAVPADCVFLASHSVDNNAPDTVYVQTAQLDGETNLKLRQALPCTVARIKSDADAAAFCGYVRCEAPNAQFDRFVGTLSVLPASSVRAGPASIASAARVDELRGGAAAADAPANDGDATAVAVADRPLPLESEQSLLRGSVIRNVDYAYGLVVYTGRETKVRVKQTTSVAKRAQVETEINRMIIILLGILVAFCLGGAVGAGVWVDAQWQGATYLRFPSKFSALDGVKQFFTFFLLNASFIPVSLYVTVRLARSLQMFFMELDAEMFHSDPDQIRATNGLEGEYPFKVRMMDLNDELGQITHVFSDKTGTLTLNYMEFRKMMVHGVSYGLGTTQIGVDRLRREGKDVTHLLEALEAERVRGRPPGSLPHVNFEDGSDTHPDRTFEADAAAPADGAAGTAIHDFLLHMALNHTVLPEVVRDNNGGIIGARLSASSPDEEAFLLAAEQLGVKFTHRAHDLVVLRARFAAEALPFADAAALAGAPTIELGGRPLKPLGAAKVNPLFQPAAGTPLARGCDMPFRVLHLLAYSQERKRMSVIVEHPVRVTDPATGAVELRLTGQGDVYLYCKGADSVIIPRCRAPGTQAGAATLKRTKLQLSDWGNDGLRTLVFAQRKLSAAEFSSFSEKFTAACGDIDSIRKRKAKQPNRIDELMNAIESDMDLQGASANEDKLQPEVPETIALLGQGGIKVWMVTGDKQETAVNIGFATRLLDESMRQIVATQESAGGVQAAVKRIRIAAKRMRRERREDAVQAASARSGVEAAVAFVAAQLEALETSLGFAASRGDNSEAAIAAAAAAASPRGGGAPRQSLSRSTSDAAAAPGEVLVSTGQPARARADSFASDVDEEEYAGDLSSSITHAAAGHDSDAGSVRSVSSLSSHKQPSFVANGGQLQVKTPRDDAGHAAAGPGGGGGGALRPQRRPFALVIDEHTLDAALGHPKARAYLLYVAVKCSAVIACRARPDQKARIVKLIREGVPSSRTLSVGDGANDVDMIRAAHVGVGISGAEGVQAANASDYAIGRFRFLQRLLLVHGRWNYNRMARIVLYSFYKNMVFVSAQFWFSLFTGLSGQKLYVEYGTQTFNLIFTSLPVIVMGIYDTDVDAAFALKFPQLYDDGRLSRALNVRVFLSWCIGALLEALSIYFVVYASWVAPDRDFGATPYIFTFGTTLFTCVIAVVTLRMAAEMHKHHWFFVAITSLSAILWLPACFAFDLMDADALKGGISRVFGSAAFWLTLVLVCGYTTARTLAWKAWKRFNAPELRHIVHEVQAITHDDSNVVRYCEAADLARRTGRSIADVMAAAAVVDAGRKELQAQRRTAQLNAVGPGGGSGGGGGGGAAGLQAFKSTAGAALPAGRADSFKSTPASSVAPASASAARASN